MADQTLEEMKRRLLELEGEPVPAATVQTPDSLEGMKARLVELEGPAAPPPEATPESSFLEKAQHVGKRWVSGLLDTADLPYYLREGAAAAGEYIPDTVKDVVGKHPYVQYANKMRDLVMPDVLSGKAQATETVPGLTQARDWADQSPLSAEQLADSPVTRGIGTGAEWVGVPGLGAGSKVLKTGLEEATKRLAKETRDSAITATGAGGGSELGLYLSEEGGAPGELIGGLIGVATAWKTGKVEGLTLAQRKMLTKLKNQFDDPDEAIKRLRERLDPAVGEVEIGTVADLTRDRNVANVESMIAGTKEGAQALPRTLEARINQIYDETMAPLRGEGTHVEVGVGQARDQIARDKVGLEQATNRVIAETEGKGTVLRKALDQEAAQATREAATARTAARQADVVAGDTKAAVDPGGRPDQYSTNVTGKYTAAETDHRAITQELYDEFDAGPDIVTAPFKGAAAEFLSDMDPAEAAALTEKYGKYFKAIDEFEPTVSPRGLSLRIQQMKADVNNAHQNGTAGFEEGKLREFYTKLEDALAQPAVSQRYADAVSSYKEGSDRFGPGYIKGIRKTAEPEELLSQIGLQGDRGAASARLLAESKIPELQDDVGDYIRAQAVRAQNLDEGFLVQYEAVLDNLPPNVRQEIVGLIEARAAQQTTKGLSKAAASEEATTAKRTGKEQGRLNKSVAAEVESAKRTSANTRDALDSDVRGQYAKGFEEADRLVDDMLTKPDGAAQLKELMEELGEVGGDAVDSLKTRVTERVDNQLFEIFTTPSGESRQATGSALKKFRDMRRRLVDADLLDGADADYIDGVLERTQSDILRKEASARVGDIASGDSGKANLFASLLSAITLAPLPGGYNLQLGGAVRREFKTVLEAEPTKKNIKALTEYLNNPQKFLEGLDKLKTPEAQTRAFFTKLVGAGQVAEIIGGG